MQGTLLLFVLCFLQTMLNGLLEAATDTNKCKYCTLLVDSFKAGMKKTENQHFAGGNTDWEERNLGKFAKSETRLVEIMEYVCKLKYVDSSEKLNGVKDIEFKCHQLAEEHEEDIESWYFYKQSSDPDLLLWLCFGKLSLCCPDGHFQKDCKPCPGVDRKLPVCFGRGKCDGDGSREGTGKCKCDKGYIGLMCSNCDSNYYPATQTTDSVECKECHNSCTGGCTAEGPPGCKACRSGWIFNEGEGCKDIDECEEIGVCKGEHTVCVNTDGSFVCRCDEGYAKNAEGVCALDIEAPPKELWVRPDALLRSIALSSLCVLLTVVVWRRSLPLAIFAAVCVLIVLYIEFRIDNSFSPESLFRRKPL